MAAYAACPQMAASVSRARTSPITAYLSEDDRILWAKTVGGMSYKDVEVPNDAITPQPNDVVSIAYTASILGGPKVEQVLAKRPLSFVLSDTTDTTSDDGDDISVSPFIFTEAIRGMRLGGKRRLLVPPSSRYAVPNAKETIELEVEIVKVRMGPEATFYKLGGFRSLFRLAIVLSFVPDVANWINTTPLLNGGATTASVDAAVALAAAHPAAVDAANRWAVDGLARLGM